MHNVLRAQVIATYAHYYTELVYTNISDVRILTNNATGPNSIPVVFNTAVRECELRVYCVYSPLAPEQSSTAATSSATKFMAVLLVLGKAMRRRTVAARTTPCKVVLQ